MGAPEQDNQPNKQDRAILTIPQKVICLHQPPPPHPSKMDAIICAQALSNATNKLVLAQKAAGAGTAEIALHQRDFAHAESELKHAKEAAAKARALVDLDLGANTKRHFRSS